MSYVDGYVIPVIAARFEEYRLKAVESAKLWLEHGALSVIEAKADDAPMGKVTSFPRSVQLQEDEVAVLGYVTYRDRAHRDAVQTAVFQDPRMNAIMQDLPMDGKRMIWGGFEAFVEV